MAKMITDIPQLPTRLRDGHKGDYGKILIIGGSRGMIGAPSLAAQAALRSGAGLVRIAVPESIQLSVAQLTPCATTIPLAEDEKGMLSRAGEVEISQALADIDVVALGPGLGLSNDLQGIVTKVVKDFVGPIVIDADGLNNLAAAGVMQLTANTILTPHPGEMQRLWRACFREKLPEQRQEQAEKLALRCGAVVALKGAGTVITDGKKTYINTTGNPGMATGGSGDVLTGCIAALAGQGLSALNASILGVYAHGYAGDLAAKELSETAMTANDIIEYLGRAWRKK